MNNDTRRFVIIPYSDLIVKEWFSEWFQDQIGSYRLSYLFEQCAILHRTKQHKTSAKDTVFYKISAEQAERKFKRIQKFLPKKWRILCSEKFGTIIAIEESFVFWLLKQEEYREELYNECWEITNEKINPSIS